MLNSKDNYDENQSKVYSDYNIKLILFFTLGIIANFMKEDANTICADCEAKQPR